MSSAVPLNESSCFPLVSVIIPIYNGEADLPDLLNCLVRQDYPVDRVEYCLVDNGSQDHTLSSLTAFAKAVPSLRIHVLAEVEIQSSYAARNTGIRSARGEILAFTDADCRPEANWIAQLVQPFRQPDVGIVAGEVLALPGNNWLERYADRHTTLSQTHTLAHPFCAYGQTANLAIRRTCLQAVGLFRPYLTTGGDADLCWRVLQTGNWQIHLAEAAIVRHRHRSTLRELQSQWQRYGRSNRYLHELHGVNLMRELTFREVVYRCGRWGLKEIPLAILKISDRRCGFSQFIDTVVDTPLDLFCRQARTQGQRQAHLPEAARRITEWSEPSVQP